MGKVAVVTDSTADLGHLSIGELPISIVPLSVNWGRDILRDGIDIVPAEFYTRLRVDRDSPYTAAPPIGIFEELYRNLLSAYDAVVSIHVAAALSATHSVAQSAAQTIDAARISVVDSTTTSIGLGWLAHRAAVLAAEGAVAEAILDAMHDMIPRVRVYVTLETLEYLQRGGRIGRAQAFLGSLLSVKPILQVKDGAVLPVERVRTRAASVRRLAEIAQQAGPKEAIAVAHGDCEEEAATLREEIKRREQVARVPVAEIGAVLGTHSGPGVIGVGFVLAS